MEMRHGRVAGTFRDSQSRSSTRCWRKASFYGVFCRACHRSGGRTLQPAETSSVDAITRIIKALVKQQSTCRCDSGMLRSKSKTRLEETHLPALSRCSHGGALMLIVSALLPPFCLSTRSRPSRRPATSVETRRTESQKVKENSLSESRRTRCILRYVLSFILRAANCAICLLL